ncbi:hypothetical protein LZ31DRAFT_55987 [Colletotrichum somersetense]|nr:hypothetical protein LZ31DRAFT_55987 [Colletotrichum somersetense]
MIRSLSSFTFRSNGFRFLFINWMGFVCGSGRGRDTLALAGSARCTICMYIPTDLGKKAGYDLTSLDSYFHEREIGSAYGYSESMLTVAKQSANHACEGWCFSQVFQLLFHFREFPSPVLVHWGGMQRGKGNQWPIGFAFALVLVQRRDRLFEAVRQLSSVLGRRNGQKKGFRPSCS